MIDINNIPWDQIQPIDVKHQIEKIEISENFFFEFKEDEETPAKLVKEISAFANTYGGYIIIGVDNNKNIKGCKKWNENRVHTTIHDSLSPVPLFDIKNVQIDGADILVIRIEEGTQPPYIVRDGRIYERISSGSYPIQNSSKLDNLYQKRRDYYEDIAKNIELPPIDYNMQLCPRNLCACIDVGTYIRCRDKLLFSADFYNSSIYEKIASIINEWHYEFSISIIGQSILISVVKQSAKDKNNKPVSMGEGIQNFLEIKRDGTFRFRILLSTDVDSDNANITGINLLVRIFSDIYRLLVGNSFADIFIDAEKYEKLSVFQQFVPYYYLNQSNDPAAIDAHKRLYDEHFRKYGGNSIIIGNRFPTTGYLHFDHTIFDEYGEEWNTNNIINQLFATTYSNLGFIENPTW